MNVLRLLPAETIATIVSCNASQIQVEVTRGGRNTLGLVRVAGKEKIRVSAQSVQVIEVTGPTCPANTAVVVDTIAQTSKGIELNPTVTNCPRGRMWVQIVNTTGEDIFLAACVHQVSMIDDHTVLCHSVEDCGRHDHLTQKEALNTSGLIWEGLNEHQQQQAEALLNRNADVFASSDDDLGYTETVTHKIRTVDDEPI